MFGSDFWKVSLSHVHLFVVVFLWDFSACLLNPVMTDVFVAALCRSQSHVCSTALYLTGFQQAVMGLGATVLLPVLGNLSDVYGRKKFLLIPFILAIIPTAILSWGRTTDFFYAYYAFKCLTGMVSGAFVFCIALTRLAEDVPQERRVSAFGMLSGVINGANLTSTLAARFLSTAQTFQVATVALIVAAVYLIAFLKENKHHNDYSSGLEQPILDHEADDDSESSKNVDFMRNIPSLKSILSLLKSSNVFSLLACVTFFNSLAEVAGQNFIQYYFKARFEFNKDQFAEIFLIMYVGASVSTTFFVPVVSRFIGEETLLILGLFGGFLHMFIDSIAWSGWVPYASASLGFLYAIAQPNLSCIVSKLVGVDKQGIGQGCILGIATLTFAISPLIFTPLSVIFFPEEEGGEGGKTASGLSLLLPGLSIFCIALVYLIAVVLSIFIKIISIRRYNAAAAMAIQDSS